MLNPVPQLGPPPPTPVANSVTAMNPQDFLKLLLTQLQSQDPTQPVTNQDLLNQITSIRTLQSNMDLSTNMTTMANQQQIASAGALIGKYVQGQDSGANAVSGTVTSISIQSGAVDLNLDSGSQVPLGNLTQIGQPSTSQGSTPAGN